MRQQAPTGVFRFSFLVFRKGGRSAMRPYKVVGRHQGSDPWRGPHSGVRGADVLSLGVSLVDQPGLGRAAVYRKYSSHDGAGSR